MTDPNPPVIIRKKRLSRKEQKARKKQRHNGDGQAPTTNKNEIKPSKENTSFEVVDNTSAKHPAKKKPECDPAAFEAQPLQTDIPYIPTPVPELEDANKRRQYNDKTLGKWFPKARVVKSRPSTSEHCTILLFYQYKSPGHWKESQVEQLMRYLQLIAEARPHIGGRLRVAPEGINATLSCGDSKEGTNGRTILEHFCKDLQQFDNIFLETDYKYLPAKADRHFKDLKILPVQELVFYGLQEPQAPLQSTGVHLEAKDFHAMLEDTTKETVVVDVRNHYEAALGRFDGQAVQGKGAEYVDPKMRKSTDFPSWVKESAEQLKGKRVMMYCTGGVRCERASAYLKSTMGDELEGVYQLQGGIERYLQSFPDGGYWRGKNFVFDKRESVSAENPNGDGGVIRKKKRGKQQSMPEGIDTKCCLCDEPWDRYVGKKKCETCGVPVLMCEKCIPLHKKWHKDKDAVPPKLARCPLCIEQDITVPVDAVEYTDNGVKIKAKSQDEHGKAAPSVCKWGGGHATDKKERRRAKKLSMHPHNHTNTSHPTTLEEASAASLSRHHEDDQVF